MIVRKANLYALKALPFKFLAALGSNVEKDDLRMKAAASIFERSLSEKVM